MSSTVTVELQVETFPFTSVTVKTEVFAPTFEQLNEVGLAVTEAMPQASLDPLFIAAAEVLPFPDPFSWTVTLRQTAFGGVLSGVSVMVTVKDAVQLFASVAITV